MTVSFRSLLCIMMVITGASRCTPNPFKEHISACQVIQNLLANVRRRSGTFLLTCVFFFFLKIKFVNY